MVSISSKNNSKIKDLIKLRNNSKFRNDKSLFYVEGERILKDTKSSIIRELYIKKSKLDYFSKFLKKCNKADIFIVDDDIYDKITDTVNSQGMIAVVNYDILHELDDTFLEKVSLCIILDGINDPGNIGTIFRVAESSNVDLIILINNSCSIYNPKVIRASMSSIFRDKIYVADNVDEIYDKLNNNGFMIYATSLSEKANMYTDINYTDKIAIVFGNEANGVSQASVNRSHSLIKIPMKGKIESLNVSISTSIILYEIMRQNNFYET